ncbi:TadE/TadG family type IV pilus assembly protein [Demequina litorisediminis]|uniref:TadE/TadG family type IV pilus assembly protein n=1 Tax=Demequina litorisediminis TaxID=1849022 RepID=UPI0024E193F8|nr:hypothetical protein [Demequina litorisediminis]
MRILRNRIEGRSEEGQALVLVLGMVIVMAGVLMVVASTTVFGSYFTTQSRASVESQSAADAGVDVAYATMDSDPAACVALDGHFQSSAVPAYDAQVFYDQDGTGSWTEGCPDLEDKDNWPDFVKVVSTGTAQSNGVGGYEAGDQAEVTALWTKPEDPPTFNHAVRADTFVGTNAIQSIASEEDDATIFTKGNLACDAGTKVPGSIYVKGDVHFKNSNCGTDGDMYVGGNLYFPAATSGTTVGGNLTVAGNIASGNYPRALSNFTTAKWYTAVYPKVGGTTRARGYLDGYCAYPAKVFLPSSVFAPYAEKDECMTSSNYSTPQRTFMLDMSVPKPDEYDVFEEDFEVFRPDDPIFDNYTKKAWNDPSYPTNLIAGTECRTSHITGTMEITENTLIDTTAACSTGIHMGYGGNLTIKALRGPRHLRLVHQEGPGAQHYLR